MTNALTYQHNFAHARQVSELSVELDFLLKPELWPWLSLPPAHPVLIEKYQYFGATTASWAMQLFAPESYTALTRFRWSCGDAAWGTQYPDSGLCTGRNDKSGMGFQLDVSNSQGDNFYRTAGDGFVFTDRDFRLWREKTRQQTQQSNRMGAIALASSSQCGLDPFGKSFIGASDNAARYFAHVARESSFHPQHPFHTGSGDHVNAAQLLDCALQTIHLHVGAGRAWESPLQCQSGEAQFQRYVELDIPFEIHLEVEKEKAQFALQFSQAGHANAMIKMQMRDHENLG
ncbi:MAG: hypothetical protein ACSHXK_09530 [Oceanococcus sp.]